MMTDFVRLRHLVGIVHGLGPRPLLELFLELLRNNEVDGDRLLPRLEAYATIDREALVLLGGDRLPDPFLMEIPRKVDDDE